MAELSELETEVAVLKTNVANHLEQCRKTHKDMNGNLTRIWDTLTKMQDKIERRLPLWATGLITLLSSITVGLIVAASK